MALADWDSPKAATPATNATDQRRDEVANEGCVATVATVAADLEAIDRLLRKLADLEGWPDITLNDRLSERCRMALVNVPEALEALRAAVAVPVDPAAKRPANRPRIVLCRLTAGLL